MNLLPAFVGAPELNKVYHCDAFELMRHIPDGSIDAVITDPPYGIGLDTWDKPIDIERFVDECYRVLKPTGFLFFTTQMPAMLDWLIALRDSAFQFRDHISWIKRLVTSIATPLNRSHESVFIYAKSKDAKYFKTKGLYTDVKIPSVLALAMGIEGIDRHIKDLRLKAQGIQPSKQKENYQRNRVYSSFEKAESDRSPEFANFTNVWSFLPEAHVKKGKGRRHPTSKPLAMFERALELLTPPTATILDPFSGGGTTALACRNLGRNYLACDLALEFVEMARERLNEPMMKPMFEAVEYEPLPRNVPMFEVAGD